MDLYLIIPETAWLATGEPTKETKESQVRTAQYKEINPARPLPCRLWLRHAHPVRLGHAPSGKRISCCFGSFASYGCRTVQKGNEAGGRRTGA